MVHVTVTLQEVLSKVRQSEGKGQKSILAIVEHNSSYFIQQFQLSGVDIDFTNHSFTITGDDHQMVVMAKQRIAAMLQEPLFTMNVNPTVIVGMRLLNEAKKPFSQETGCWLHFAWASHTIRCYGLCAAAARQYIQTILQHVDHCTSIDGGIDGNVVTEEAYDRQLKPLIKKYINYIETETTAKLAVQKDDAQARLITVQFYGKYNAIEQAKHMIKYELKEVQLRELGLKAAANLTQADPLHDLLKDTCSTLATDGPYPILLSCAGEESGTQGQRVLLIPVRKNSAAASQKPACSVPGASLRTIAEIPPHTMPERLSTPPLLPHGKLLPDLDLPLVPPGGYIPPSQSRHSSIASSCEGSVGPECYSTSTSADLSLGSPGIADSLPPRNHTVSMADIHLLRKSPNRYTHLLSPNLKNLLETGLPGNVHRSGRPCPGPLRPPPMEATRSRSHGDLVDLLSTLKCSDPTTGRSDPPAFQMPQVPPNVLRSLCALGQKNIGDQSSSSNASDQPSSTLPPRSASEQSAMKATNSNSEALNRVHHLVSRAAVNFNWVAGLLKWIDQSQLDVQELTKYLESQVEQSASELLASQMELAMDDLLE